MTVNIRARGFEFDSVKPVQGIVYDEAKEQAKAQMMHSFITTVIAWDIVIFGAWVCKWWYDGGYHWMFWAFAKWCPWLLHMIESGSVV